MEGNCTLNHVFEKIDDNLGNINIKSYRVSIPALEDVFLNIASEDVSQRMNNITQIQ